MVQYDVIVVGGGPVGLFAASELAIRGLKVIVYEKRLKRTAHSRGLAFHGRSLDIMASRGLLQQFLDHGTKVPVTHYGGLETMIFLHKLDVSFPFALHIPQPQTEQLLEEHALDLGVSILRDHAVQCIEQNEAGVSVAGTCSDGAVFEATARYLIGADGGRSTTRKAANILFDGHDPTCKYILADVEFDGGLEVPPTFVVNPDGSGNSLILGFGDGIHHRVILIDPQHIGRDPKVPITEDELRDSVSRLRPGLSIKSSLWTSQFTDETKIARSYKSGNVFLAGDAAHLHLSAGGHGMNLGLQDAMNLGWKLAAVMQGRAPEELLATYESERRPIALRINQTTLSQGALMSKFDGQTIALRMRLKEWLKTPELNHDLAMEASGFGLIYDLSSKASKNGLTPGGNWERVETSVVVKDAQLWENPDSPEGKKTSLRNLGLNGDWVEIWKADTFERDAPLAFPGWTQRGIAAQPMKELATHKAILVRPDGHLGYYQ